jgi:trigger factor
MNITKEPTGDYTASLTIDITPEDFLPKVNESLDKLRKKANIPGFRPGKAPLGLVKRQYGKSAILEEVNQMAFENINQYIVENKLRIIGRPLVNLEKTAPIEDLTETQNYSFTFDIGILPEFEVNVTPEVVVDFKKVNVSDEALEKEIDALRKRHSSFDKTDVITDDCMVTGKLIISDPDQVPEEVESENPKKNNLFRYFNIDKLNDNPKIQKLFIGAKQGDEIQISVDDIENREAIQFLIPESTDIEKEGIILTFIPDETYISKPAELTSEFFEQSFPGRNISDEDEFRSVLKQELEYHFHRQCDDIFLHSVRKKIISGTNLPLPAEFVKRFLIENSKEENEEKIQDLEEKFDDYLEVIKWEFIQDKIFEKFDIKIGIDDFKEYIRGFYRDYLKQDDVTEEQVETELKQMIEDKKRMDSIEENVRRKKSLDLFKTQLTINVIEFDSFEEMTLSEKSKEQQDDSKKI